MKALAKFLKKVSGVAAKEEAAADKFALKKLLAGISKKEGPSGNPFLDLPGGNVLRQKDFKPIGPNHYEETWKPAVPEQHPDRSFGVFKVSASDQGTGGMMDVAGLDAPYQRKGLGKAIYQQLADHYGSLESSDNVTTKAARRVYDRLGASLTDSINNVGEPRYLLRGRDKGKRWGIFGEDD